MAKNGSYMIGEIAMIEKVSGVNFADLDDDKMPPAMVMVAMAYVLLRRDALAAGNPVNTVALADAEALDTDDFVALMARHGFEDDGTEAAPDFPNPPTETETWHSSLSASASPLPSTGI